MTCDMKKIGVILRPWHLKLMTRRSVVRFRVVDIFALLVCWALGYFSPLRRARPNRTVCIDMPTLRYRYPGQTARK